MSVFSIDARSNSCSALPARPAAFTLSGGMPHSFPPAPAPICLLWGKDRFARSALLARIAAEADNRALATFALYDPLLPHRMTALSVEGLGTFLLSAPLDAIDRLIDCSSVASLTASDKAEAHLAKLEEQIVLEGRILCDCRRLLSQIAAPIIDGAALAAKARRIAARIPKGSGGVETVAVTAGEADWSLPFGEEVTVIGLPAAYSLSAHCLTALERALREAGRNQIILTNGLTGETVGIYLPARAVCYLADAPEGICRRTLSSARLFLPHTTEARQCWRHLEAASQVPAHRLQALLQEYRAIAAKEEADCTAGDGKSRLQSFCKRLLIELFCQ